ncbi:MAG: type II toxin-antitoxin system VapC family toxin [Thermoanaerobaculia bacterium]|nr:type II toxin-antitoxin system VapC family toxin [Thermoanaerobaculia bacterium]
MKYLLDTNVLSEVMRKRPDEGVMRRLQSERPSDLVTSVVCVSELRYGAARVSGTVKLWDRIAREVLSKIEALPLGAAEALRAGDVLADLEARGEPIGIEDVWIAATAMENRLIVVTRNLRHFERVPELKCESWWG